MSDEFMYAVMETYVDFSRSSIIHQDSYLLNKDKAQKVVDENWPKGTEVGVETYRPLSVSDLVNKHTIDRLERVLKDWEEDHTFSVDDKYHVSVSSTAKSRGILTEALEKCVKITKGSYIECDFKTTFVSRGK